MKNHSKKIEKPTERLSPREAEVMTLIAQGKTHPAIALQLSISVETIRTHIKHACKKLKATNKINAISLAIAFDLISPLWGIASQGVHPVKAQGHKRANTSNHA